MDNINNLLKLIILIANKIKEILLEKNIELLKVTSLDFCFILRKKVEGEEDEK